MGNLNVGIREGKANLSKLLSMVKKGKEIVLTDHGRPVVKLVPIDKGALPLSSRIREMKATGILEPVTGRGPRRLPSPGGRVLKQNVLHNWMVQSVRSSFGLKRQKSHSI